MKQLSIFTTLFFVAVALVTQEPVNSPTPVVPVPSILESEEVPPLVDVSQTQQSRILAVESSQAKFLMAKSARIIPVTDDGVLVLVEELKEGEVVHAVILKVSGVDDYQVNAFLVSEGIEKAFPPREIEKSELGDYIIEGEPGDKFAIQVLLRDNTSIWSKSVTIEGTVTEPTDPEEPDTPPSPPGDWTELRKVVQETTPDEPEVLRVLISSYEKSLEDIKNGDFSTAEQARAYLSAARRRDFLEEIAVVKKDWSVFLYGVSDIVSKISEKQKYINAMESVVTELKKKL